MPSTEKEVETLAIELYAEDGMPMLCYDTPEQSWEADRINVRERYRLKATEQLNASASADVIRQGKQWQA